MKVDEEIMSFIKINYFQRNECKAFLNKQKVDIKSGTLKIDRMVSQII